MEEVGNMRYALLQGWGMLLAWYPCIAGSHMVIRSFKHDAGLSRFLRLWWCPLTWRV